MEERRCDAFCPPQNGSKDRDPLPEGGRLGPSLIYIVRRPLDVAAVPDADDGSAVAASASSPLVRAVLGLPRRYVAFPLPMVQGACCCFATSPGAYASSASAMTALNVLSGSWLVL